MRALRPAAPAAPRLTRRRALALGAAAGVGALVPRPAAGWAAPRRAALRSFGMDVPGSAFAGGRTTGILRAPRAFDLFGARGAGLGRAGLEARVRPAGGAWSPWVPLGGVHAPDAGRSLGATDPVWAGGARELQLRSGHPVGGLRLLFVSVPPPARAARARARAAAGPRGPAVRKPRRLPPGLRRSSRATNGGPPPCRREPRRSSAPSRWRSCTTPSPRTTTRPRTPPRIVLGIAKYHRDTNGWNDIGYNFLVDKYGQVFEGREGGVDQPVVGAQAQGWNSQSTGVATLGTFEAAAFPAAGMAALARVVAWKLSIHGVPTQGTVALVSAGGSDNRYAKGATVSFNRIAGHRDGCKTSCPGSALYAQLGELRSRAGAQAGTIAATPKLSLVAAAASVSYGSDAVMNGRFTQPDGTGLAGAVVDVQKQGASGAFTTVARTTTGRDGTWSARVAWRRAGTVRAQARAPVTGARVRSTPVTVAVAAELTVTAPRTRVLVGRRAVVRGRARPAGSVTVVLERQDARGRWRRVAAVRGAVRGGAFRVPVRLGSAGLHRLTVGTGTGVAARRAAPVYVRAVRDRAKLSQSTSTAAPAPATPPPAAGGAPSGGAAAGASGPAGGSGSGSAGAGGAGAGGMAAG